MARYVVVGQGVVGQPPGGYAYQLFPPGTTIADSAPNAQAGDVIWPRLAAVPNMAMAPLDAPARAILTGFNPLWPLRGLIPD